MHLAAVAADGALAPVAAVAAAGAAPDQPAVATGPEPLPRSGEPAVATMPSRPFGQELRALASRYGRTLSRDRRTLALLIAQAPVIGFLITIVFHAGALASQGSPSDAVELVFMLMTASIWLGVASSCREVVKERGLVEREFDVGVRLDAYILAKALVLFALVFVQVVLLTLVIVALQPLHVSASATSRVIMLAVLTGWASVGMGLAVSCVARSVDQAAGAVPLLLMPQLLFAGALIPLARMPRVVSALANINYARWSYAGIGSAAVVGDRLQATGASAALGFDNNFFSLRSGAAAVILLGFTLVELIVATYFLRIRPPVEA
jgi:ABC transport system ATP-binding/permease protein